MTVIDAAYYAHQTVTASADFIRLIGPGCMFITCALAAWWICDRIHDYITDCRRIAAELDELAADDSQEAERAQMDALADANNNAPQTPTKHGHDRQALKTCEAIWKTPAREEKP